MIKNRRRVRSAAVRHAALELECAAFAGSGPYGDTSCVAVGYRDADFAYPPTRRRRSARRSAGRFEPRARTRPGWTTRG